MTIASCALLGAVGLTAPANAQVKSTVSTKAAQARSGKISYPSACLKGRALCISKSRRTVTFLLNGKPQMTLAARFGSRSEPTREGRFKITRMSRNHVSSIYHTPMPFAMFFSGGQAVHYSKGFARDGYRGASHGCVNTRDKPRTGWIFDRVKVGDTVYVYR